MIWNPTSSVSWWPKIRIMQSGKGYLDQIAGLKGWLKGHKKTTPEYT